MRALKINAGFTLVELLIYMGIFALAATTITGILVTTVKIQNQEVASTETTQQLNFVLTTVQRLVSQSSVVEKTYEGTNPATACTTFCTLRLRIPGSSGALDPTLVSSDANGVYLKQGAGAQTSITNSQVKVNNLKFIIYSTTGGHATVQVDASFSYNSANPQLAITKTLRSAIGRVSAATFDSDLLPDTDNNRSVGQTGPNLRWKNVYVSNLLGLGTIASDPTGLAAGSVYYNTTSNKIRAYNGTAWSDVSPFTTTGTDIYFTGGKVGIGNSAPASALDVTGSFYSRLNTVTWAATTAIDWSLGNTQKVTLGGATTFTFANGQSGGKYTLVLIQDATGSRTVTWPASVKWSGGTAPTLTTTATKTDFVGFIYDGTNYFGVGSALNF